MTCGTAFKNKGVQPMLDAVVRYLPSPLDLPPVKGKKERVGRLLEMHADNREDVEVAVAGDIVAVAGLKDTTTGDSLTAQDAPVILERMDFPDPVIKIAIEPKTKGDPE